MGLLIEQGVSNCGDCGVDLESGDALVDVYGGFNDTKQLLSNASYELGSCDCPLENVKLIVDRKAGVVGEKNECVLETKSVKEKVKAMSAKKHPKPPRPPRGLSLDSSDQKIIRELAEMAKLKRGRIERMKALKKMKEAKSSSSKNQLFATLFTIVFCLVILCQGITSRTNPAATFQGSPRTSRATGGGIMSMTRFQNWSAHGSESPSLVKQVSVSDTQKKVGRAAD